MQAISKPTSKELRSIVQEVWHVRFGENEKVSRRDLIMPTGIMHVLFNFGDDCFVVGKKGRLEKLPSVLVAGQLEQVWEIRYGGNTDQIGLALTPAGFLKLFRVPGALYAGTFIDGGPPPWNLKSLYSELKESNGFEESVALIEGYIKANAGPHESLERINGILEIIESSEGNLSMRDFAERFGLSISAFERYFKKAVGMTPKAYANIVRFRAAVKLMGDDEGPLDLFYDQSHFIKACKKFTGKTPSELMKGNEEITLDYMLKQR